MSFPNSKYVVVTGTDTGVGKTVTTAALAVALRARGQTVAVVKPVQTGLHAGEHGDLDEIIRLAGVTNAHEFARVEPALAPETAAIMVGATLPTVTEMAGLIREVVADIVLIEGAGGLLVRLDLEQGTVLDLAVALTADVVLVCREGLGTLNHVTLNLHRLAATDLVPRLVIGSCAADPGLAEAANREDLPRLTGLPLMGCVPEGAGALEREEFCADAPGWFTLG